MRVLSLCSEPRMTFLVRDILLWKPPPQPIMCESKRQMRAMLRTLHGRNKMMKLSWVGVEGAMQSPPFFFSCSHKFLRRSHIHRLHTIRGSESKSCAAMHPQG